MWPTWLRREHDEAVRETQMKLGRLPITGEWEHLLSPCAKQELRKLGLEMPDELDELEATLVPCGC